MPQSFVERALSQVGVPYEFKDISTMSGGTFTVPALTSGAVTRPGVIATPVENALRGMARLHNAMHGDEPGKRADVAALRAVYRRGQRSYNKRRHPSSSRRQHGMKRVRQHLRMLATGSRPHPRYTGDDDLLPAGHPLAVATSGERKALLVTEGRPHELGVAEPMSLATLALAIGERKSFLDTLDRLEVKSLWDADKHPRDARGRFMHLGAEVAAMIDGKQQSGTVVAMRGQNVTVRTDDGGEHVVKAGSAEVTGMAGPHSTLAEHAKAHTDADRKYRQLVTAGHPEAAAWQQRRDELGSALKGRADNLSTDQVRKGLAGEHVDGPLAPKPTQAAADGSPATAAPGNLPGMADTRPDGSDWGSGYAPGDPRNDPAYDRYVANLDAKLESALTDVGATDKLFDHVDGIDGAYQPDRKAMHDAILAELMDRYSKMPREHKAIVLAGPPGAGKSTTIKLSGHTFGVESDDKGVPTNYAVVNPDDLKEMLVARGALSPQYAQYGIGDGEAATLIHEESSHLSKRLMRQLLAHGTNTILDGTFSGDLGKNMRKVNDLRSEGYTVSGVLIDGDIERSFENAGKRHRKPPKDAPEPPVDWTGASGPLQGRYVPLGHIESQRPTGQWSDVMDRPHRSQNAENFEASRPIFNGGVHIFDNSTGEARLTYREEPEVGTTPTSEPLSDEHLAKLKAGTTGRRASTGDLPSVIALGLRQAVEKNRPQYVEAGYQGYDHADAPVGTDYFHITPQGHVHNVKKNVATGEITRKPIPRADVEKIVDHYVKPRRGGDAGARA